MSGLTILVTLRVGRSNHRLLHATAALARKLQAGVVGLAACRPIAAACGTLSVPAPLFEQDRRQISREMSAAEAEFRAAFADLGRLEWRERTAIFPLAESVALEARSADLVIVEPASTSDPVDVTRDVELADLVMRAGRPVLIVPGQAVLKLERVLVGWKDGREARRVLADALPLLGAAASVTVVEATSQDAVADARTRLAEIVGWLGHHGIAAGQQVVVAAGAHATQLDAIAETLDADLIVTGGYGHFRDGAWRPGGVTAFLLEQTRRCVLLAY